MIVKSDQHQQFSTVGVQNCGITTLFPQQKKKGLLWVAFANTQDNIVAPLTEFWVVSSCKPANHECYSENHFTMTTDKTHYYRYYSTIRLFLHASYL